MRIFDVLRWSKKEYQSSLSPKEIYDELASSNIYESSINYPNRVEELNRAFSLIKTNYKRILDLACGTGALIDALPWKSTAKIVGVDISPEMLEIARRKFAKFPNISFREGNFMDLNFPKASFDLITNAYATRFIPAGREREFAENVRRILKPNGKFIVFSDGSFRASSLFLSTLGFAPRNYNLRLNYYQDIIRRFENIFSVDKVLFIKKIPFIYSNTAVVFKNR